MRASVQPQTSLPYAWDEPILPPYLTLSVQGGTSATYNMNVSSDGDQLFYENFIYIAFKATFGEKQTDASALRRPAPMGSLVGIQWGSGGSAVQGHELVLEVQLSNNKVVLRSKVGRISFYVIRFWTLYHFKYGTCNIGFRNPETGTSCGA